MSRTSSVRGHDQATIVERKDMNLGSRGSSENSLKCGITDSPSRLWGWESGDVVDVVVQELPDGTRQVVIQEK